ncbi:MAG: hypothetical protein HQ470_05250 [Methylophilales bacterium]|nr:hypothetical protein [Methylophilales bacterium]
MSDNSVQVDSITICQFQTDWKCFYVYNLSVEGASIFNEKDSRYKAVRRAVWRYFPGLKIKIVNKWDELPLDIQKKEFESAALFSGEVLYQEDIKSNLETGEDNNDAAIQELKLKMKIAGGFFLVGESLPIISQFVVESNPTTSTVRTALILGRVGQVLKLIGAGALILD